MTTTAQALDALRQIADEAMDQKNYPAFDFIRQHIESTAAELSTLSDELMRLSDEYAFMAKRLPAKRRRALIDAALSTSNQKDTTKMIATDKLLHCLAGAVIYALAVPFGQPLAIAAALAVSVSKELLDHVLNLRAARAGLPPPHSVDPFDVLAALVGCVLFAIASDGVNMLKGMTL